MAGWVRTAAYPHRFEDEPRSMAVKESEHAAKLRDHSTLPSAMTLGPQAISVRPQAASLGPQTVAPRSSITPSPSGHRPLMKHTASTRFFVFGAAVAMTPVFMTI